MVYKLIAKHKQYGEEAYTTKAVGRPKQPINPTFVEKVVKIRTEDDYGCEKIHFILKNEGFAVSQRQIQRILDEKNLTEPCEKRRGQRSYVRYQWPISNYMWHCDWTEYENKQYIAFIDDCSRYVLECKQKEHIICFLPINADK